VIMYRLISNSIELMENMYDEDTGLFSFSTRLVQGKYINDFQNDGKYRYTVNVMAAIQRIQRSQPTKWNLKEMLDGYVARHLLNDVNAGNRGLLLDVLARENHPAAERIYLWLHPLLDDRSRALAFPIQETAWALIGVSTYARQTGSPQAMGLARKLIAYISHDLLNRNTLLPKHNNSLRGTFVSFGAIVYFLMSLHHYASLFDDQARLTLFKSAVTRVLELQGSNGEWPWFIDSATGRVMDWHQVYSVHQDAMAMLFLLPALDLGVAGTGDAIIKSYRWLFGHNALGCTMLQHNPFFIYRSIRVKGPAEQPRRLLRALTHKALGRTSRMQHPHALEVNTECRSYHPGWIIYAWADRTDFQEFTDLRIAS
jgi:hypothetical protein